MSFSDDYYSLKKKRKKKEEIAVQGGTSFEEEYYKAKNERDDLAPVGKTQTTTTKIVGVKTEKKKRKWFEKGAFEDGYDFGDLTRTILGTAGDALENAGAGLVGLGEKAWDGLLWLGAKQNEGAMMQAAQNEMIFNTVTGNKEAADKTLNRYQSYQDQVEKETAEIIVKDLYDEEKIAAFIPDAIESATGFDFEENSVFGEKIDDLAKSGGELAGTVALQALGVPWWLTSGTTAFGGEVESALQQDATFDEAGFSGLVTAGAEILTERIAGIKFGGKALTDGLDKVLARNISSKVLRTMAKFGVDATGEGAEEILSGVLSAIGQKMSYGKEKDFNELFSSEAAFESFVGGFLFGGFGNVAGVVKDSKNGVDSVTGFNETEQAVVDKVYKDRLAEAEKDGKVNKKKIYDSVLNDFDKGYISIDDIEATLGGDTYKAYQDTIANEDALQSEFDTLNKMKQGEMTGEQIDRRAELKQQLSDLKTNSQRDQLRQQLDAVMRGKVENTRLAESYNERTRRGQAFEADLAQYDAKQQAVIQKAVDSGILNNTNRTHEFVDMIAKISADKGVSFDFTNNERLKESGYAVDGATINGFVTKDGITLNIDSSKATRSVAGHEITHILEGTELYTELQNAVFEYAKTKGEYDSRLSALTKLYENVDGADVNAELTADLVGDYLFDDADFINNLSTKHRNIFQKIYDEIKYLCKVATAGSQEARELEKVKKAFEDAYRVNGKTKGDTKYSITDSNGVVLTEGQQEYFKDSKIRDDNGNLLTLYRSADGGRTIWDGRGDGSWAKGIYLTDDLYVARAFASNGKQVRDSDVLEVYAKADNPLVIDAQGNNYMDIPMPEDAPDWLVDSGDWEGRLNADQLPITAFEQGYDAVIIKNVREGVGGDPATDVILRDANQMKRTDNATPTADPDIRYSLTDNTGKELSKGQQDYFKDSKAVDDNGNLKVVYHGTRNADFTVFKRNVNYFTDSKEMADSYSPNGDMYEGYVNITKPYEIDAAGEKWSSVPVDDATKELLQQYGASVFEEDGKWRTTPADIASAIEEAVDNGELDYDGVIIKNVDDTGSYYKGEGKHLATDYIVFNSNQFKNVDNTNPTADPDIRFSLSESVEETKDLMALHNLQSDQLLKSLELGGLPMPSIAVIKAEASHEQYGEVSLILPKQAIDPKVSKDNKVYGGDAWTPTYPRIEYKANEKIAKRISDKYYELADKFGYNDVRPLYGYVSELETNLNRYSGEASMLENLYEDTDMMNVYLQDSGKGKVEPIVNEKVTKISDAEVEINEFLIDALGEDFVAKWKAPHGENPGEYKRAFLKQNESVLRDAYKGYFVDVHGFTAEEANNAMASTTLRDLSKLLNGMYLYTQNKGVSIRTETDIKATKEAIRNAAEDGYKEWVDNLFKGVEEKSGIRNNKDYYTPSGNPRSWNALHWENTLENVVKVMRQQTEKGADTFFGGTGIWAVASKDYNSIEEVKADSHRLHKMSDEEYEAVKDSYAQRFNKIAANIANKRESNWFIAQDNAMEAVVDAVRNFKTKAGILNELKQYGQLNVTEADVDDIVSLVSDIAEMPTGYFEAKPRRAVGFDEVGVFVIPRNADVKLKQELLNRGYSIAEYDPDVEGDRQKVVNQFEEYKFSLSNVGETHRYARGDAPMSDLRYVAPVQETVQEDIAPTKPLSADDMISALWDAEFKMQGYDPNAEQDASEEAARDAFKRIRDKDAPPEMEAPYYGESEPATAEDPLADRDWQSVGDRKVKAFMYENPDVKPFFQAEAGAMLGELYQTIKGERHYNDQVYYDTNGEKGWYGTKRFTSDDIAYLLDGGISYAQLERGLNAIIEDNGAENNAVSKRIELAISDRLRNGYTDFMTGEQIPPNQGYIEWVNERQHAAEYAESIDSLMADAPISEEIAPVMESQTVEDVMPIAEAPVVDAPIAQQYEAIRPKQEQQPRMAKATPAEQARAQVLTEEPKTSKKRNGLWSKAKNGVLDKGMVFEDLSLKTGNRELQAKWNSIRYAEGKAQKQIGESLKPIRDAVEKTGKTQKFYEYLYHMHNVDRMTLAERFPDMENKPVFGDTVTARESRAAIAELVRKNPEFKQYAQEVYDYNTHLREMLVEGGVISRETANLWEKMYPHYVPIRRDGDTGLNINVPLDTGRTGVNAPIKRATGGSRDILPLFDTMGQRTIQTYKAIAKNRFGVELKNTLGTTVESDALGLDEAIDSIDAQDGLLQEGKNGKNATFTVFENGEKVTFEITDEMYDAMKPTSEGLATTIKPLNVASNIFRGLTTEYNPTFIFTNPIKDVQDVLINSQHPARTYAAIPKAIKEMATHGHWYQEYVSNGGEQNTYFDKQTNAFAKEKSGLGKVLGLPLDGISKANNFIEMMPRLAEYIVSRQTGRSVDVSMLDAARVTTNFAAGGDLTKWANRNGATFLNASVQGAVQQVRNVREAKANGLKGVLTLAAKFGVAGLTATVLNGLLWGDDDEYEELSDYVKQNYYIVGKFGDGQFVRIPKGRTVAVIQDALEQMQHLVTGDDEADLKAFGELLIGNLAPNNPLENNIFAPIMQVANNKTWYGEDLVPTRLQDVPANEQYDESTDSISRWLGEKLDVSPYKINYLLNQYGGGVADTFLPMLTPEAESGDNTFAGNLLAPFKSKFTTDAVMNNQNVADFYDTVDELAVNANSSKATDRDALKYKYINSVNADMGDLYKQKREIQNSDLPDDEKYEAVRDIQQQIDEMAKEALDTYKNVSITGNYATVGDRQYRWYEPSEDSDAEAGWQKLTDKQVAKQDKVTSGLGITPSEYWDNKEEYDYAYDNPEKYAVAKSVGGYESYRGYSSDLYDIKADKDSSGKSISGSRKDKVIDYVNGLDIDYGMRIILFKSEYTADDTYNYEIVDYLNSRDDISYDEMVTILKELDFTVDSNGNISW